MTYDRIRECKSVRTLARAARLFLAWGMRPEADAAHKARLRLLDAQLRAAHSAGDVCMVGSTEHYLDAHRHGPYRGMMGLSALPTWDRYHR